MRGSVDGLLPPSMAAATAPEQLAASLAAWGASTTGESAACIWLLWLGGEWVSATPAHPP